MLRVTDSELGLLVAGSVVSLTVIAVLVTCAAMRVTDMKEIVTATIGLATTLTAGVFGYIKGVGDGKASAAGGGS